MLGGFKHFVIFQNRWDNQSFPLTNSYFSRWLLHHPPVAGCQCGKLTAINNPQAITRFMGGDLNHPQNARFLVRLGFAHSHGFRRLNPVLYKQ